MANFEVGAFFGRGTLKVGDSICDDTESMSLDPSPSKTAEKVDRIGKELEQVWRAEWSRLTIVTQNNCNIQIK